MANLSDITNSSGQSFNSGSKPPRRGGAGGHSTKMTVKPKKNKKKKSTPKPAPVAPPKKKVDNSLGEPTEKPTGSKVYTLGGKLVEDTLTIAKPPKPKPVVAKKKVDTLTRQEKKLDPTPKVHSTPKPKPKLTISKDKIGYGEGKVDPKLAQAVNKPKPKLTISKDKIGYGEGKVDPKLAQAVNKPAPVPEKKADTLTRQEKKLDPKPVKKVKETPRLSTAVKDGPKFVRKYTGTKSTTKENHRYKRGTSFWDRMYSPKPKPKVPKKKVDTLTRQEKKLDPTPKPKAVVTKKKANPKGGKPMIEQKLITKGNNVATDVKKAADDRGPTPTKYNQEYWAKKVADGVSQADLAAEQKTLGIKKAYSGDKVVTKANADTAAYKLKKVTGSDATLQNGGVSKTTKTSGITGAGAEGKGENFTTTYDYKNGPKIVQKGTDPVLTIGDSKVRLGDRKSTTYVDGVETATKTGHDPLGRAAKVTKTNRAGHISDTVKADNQPKAAPKTGANASKQATASSGPAGTSVQPDNLKNVLAITKNKKAKGKRSLNNKRKGGGISFGTGGAGLNIPT